METLAHLSPLELDMQELEAMEAPGFWSGFQQGWDIGWQISKPATVGLTIYFT